MKNILKNKLISSVCILSIFSSHAVGMENDEESSAQINRRNQFQDEVKKLYNRLAGEGHVFAEEDTMVDVLAYLISPEEEGKQAQIGHAVLSIIGGTEENPYFWAADFDGSYGTLEDFARNILASTPGKIQILDDPDQENSTFFEGDTCREFSKWKYKTWTIPNTKANIIKEELKNARSNPPLYSATGLNIDPFAQAWHTYNSSMWVEKIIQEKEILAEEEAINHMKIAGKELGEDSFLVWLVGSAYKHSHDAVPLFLKETGGCILDIFPILKLLKCKNPLKVLEILPDIATGMGQRATWFVNQIPQITSFVEEEISKNKKKRPREAWEVVLDRAGNGEEGNTFIKKPKLMEQKY